MYRDKLKCVCGILIDVAQQKFCEECGADIKILNDSYHQLEQDPEYLELKKKLDEKEKSFQRVTEAKIKEERRSLEYAKRISELDIQINEKRNLIAEKSAWMKNCKKCWPGPVTAHAVKWKSGSRPGASRSMAR